MQNASVQAQGCEQPVELIGNVGGEEREHSADVTHARDLKEWEVKLQPTLKSLHNSLENREKLLRENSRWWSRNIPSSWCGTRHTPPYSKDARWSHTPCARQCGLWAATGARTNLFYDRLATWWYRPAIRMAPLTLAHRRTLDPIRTRFRKSYRPVPSLPETTSSKSRSFSVSARDRPLNTLPEKFEHTLNRRFLCSRPFLVPSVSFSQSHQEFSRHVSCTRQTSPRDARDPCF